MLQPIKIKNILIQKVNIKDGVQDGRKLGFLDLYDRYT